MSCLFGSPDSSRVSFPSGAEPVEKKVTIDPDEGLDKVPPILAMEKPYQINIELDSFTLGWQPAIYPQNAKAVPIKYVDTRSLLASWSLLSVCVCSQCEGIRSHWCNTHAECSCSPAANFSKQILSPCTVQVLGSNFCMWMVKFALRLQVHRGTAHSAQHAVEAVRVQPGGRQVRREELRREEGLHVSRHRHQRVRHLRPIQLALRLRQDK